MLYEYYLYKYFYFNFILKKNEINKSIIINIIIRMENEYTDNGYNTDTNNNSDDNVRAPDKTKKNNYSKITEVNMTSKWMKQCI